MTSTRPASRAPLGAAGLVLAGLFCQELGASFAVLLFPTVGALGMVALRLVFSAIVLLLICRPRLRAHSRRDWLTVTGFGLTLAAMNVLFYEALARLPLGAAVTIEVLGPLLLSVIVSRRAASWLWAVLAFVGVALLSRGGLEELDPVGVAFAAGAGVAWAGYILMSARTGARFPKLDGLAIAMAIGAIVTLPFGLATSGSALFSPAVLLLGLAVALLSSAIPYALELLALRRLAAASFSILMSLAPAIAAIAGALVLGQELTLISGFAILLVVAASAGAVRSASLHARRQADQAVPVP
ncbi:EamA family transporter [Mycetocola miduiensis]|uniref:Inner membrane transporter RhtA n=1 Tax=Mycetocola miduiensis TaxID=995034 RepID=A0A1I4YBC7_9MICO|nr:EamA family transporter [Mycetocola miduiensis]SFN35316.1 inner membrane transporter RhtA [Mycetocola miduiensis]